jgi:hypothetical protein
MFFKSKPKSVPKLVYPEEDLSATCIIFRNKTYASIREGK